MSKKTIKNFKKTIINQFNLSQKLNQFDCVIIDFKNNRIGVLKENEIIN